MVFYLKESDTIYEQLSSHKISKR